MIVHVVVVRLLDIDRLLRIRTLVANPALLHYTKLQVVQILLAMIMMPRSPHGQNGAAVTWIVVQEKSKELDGLSASLRLELVPTVVLLMELASMDLCSRQLLVNRRTAVPSHETAFGALGLFGLNATAFAAVDISPA